MDVQKKTLLILYTTKLQKYKNYKIQKC